MSTKQVRLTQWVFYGALALLMVLILSGALAMIAPASIATRVAYNSEAYLFALILAAWIQFAIPRLRDRRLMMWALMHGALWALIGVSLIAGAMWINDFPSRLATLNEPAIALAILIPYVSLRRPLPRWTLAIVPLSVGVVVWAVGWAPDSWVIDQAETFGLVILAILTLDVFDRVLLERGAPVNRGIRLAWYGFMILEPILVSTIGTGVRSGEGAIALSLEFLGRIHESFVGVLLVALVLHLVRLRRRP